MSPLADWPALARGGGADYFINCMTCVRLYLWYSTAMILDWTFFAGAHAVPHACVARPLRFYVVGTLFSIIVNVQKHTRCRYKKNAPDDGSKQLIRQMTKQDLQAETAWCVSELSYFTP